MLTTAFRILAIASLTATTFQAPTAPTAAPAPAIRQILAEPIYVAGYSVHTSRNAEQGGAGEIPKLWTNFYTQNLIEQIPHRVDDSLIVVYSDYTSDEKGEYTYLLGAPVSTIEGLPKDLTYRRIPAGSYALVQSENGAFQQVIPAAWQKAWTLTPAELGGKRSFAIDYETYEMSSPGNGQVTIHLGISPSAK